ncbi:nucleoside/nucleotide kinase family protein [Streptomyces sp. NPDC102274]|uniref:nucleoside/nucleotide kinase family protein n=1 Tax=Streptomyces sp. NPDC102274 TaxID=3366151 RepID=UPI0038171444
MTHPHHLDSLGQGTCDAPAETAFSALRDRARALAESGRRAILGIVGAPGSGKSTLAFHLAAALGPDTAVVVPMDGFHLANGELNRLGRRQRKGAPDTFDAAGYAALLRRLRDQTENCVYAPRFHREFEEAIAGAIPVPAGVPLVITEGNYLLLDDGPWAGVKALLDEAWYVATDEATRLNQLIQRHVAYGKPLAEARAWSLGSDQRNADLVAATPHRADLVFSPPLLDRIPIDQVPNRTDPDSSAGHHPLNE